MYSICSSRCINSNHENHVSKETEKIKRVTRVSSAKNNNHPKCNNQNSNPKEFIKIKRISPPRLVKPITVDPKDIYCETYGFIVLLYY